MKHRFPLAVVAICLGLPSLAMSRPNDNQQANPRDPRHEQPGLANEPRDEPRNPVRPASAAGRPNEQEMRTQFEEHLRQTQDAARARRKEIRKDPKAWNDGRSLRAETHRRDIAQTFANIVSMPEARAKLTTQCGPNGSAQSHPLDLAEDKADAATISRSNELIRRENARDARVIAALRARLGAQ